MDVKGNDVGHRVYTDHPQGDLGAKKRDDDGHGGDGEVPEEDG